MSRSATRSPKKTKGGIVALALTWDGARWPISLLPAMARAFLTTPQSPTSKPNSRTVSKLLLEGQVQELRICWVPQLKGGSDVLSEPFQAPENKRLGFRATKMIQLGEICGMVYRR